MKCCNCANWNLRESALRELGFGLCKAEQDPVFAKARTLSATNVCRFGHFASASPQVIALRAKALSLTLEEIAE